MAIIEKKFLYLWRGGRGKGIRYSKIMYFMNRNVIKVDDDISIEFYTGGIKGNNCPHCTWLQCISHPLT